MQFERAQAATFTAQILLVHAASSLSNGGVKLICVHYRRVCDRYETWANIPLYAAVSHFHCILAALDLSAPSLKVTVNVASEMHSNVAHYVAHYVYVAA